MEITEVRIKLMEDPGERLQAFCSITFDDCFVIRDLKIIEGTSGPFVAMPSRKLTGHCPQCGCKNHLRAGYCNQCGAKLKEPALSKDDDGRAKLYADIAHPINSACREMIQEKVIKAFYEEIERSKQPGYVSSYDDWDDEVLAGLKQRRDTAHRSSGPNSTLPHSGQPKAENKPEPSAPHGAISPPKSLPRTDEVASNAPPANNANKKSSFGAGIFNGS